MTLTPGIDQGAISLFGLTLRNPWGIVPNARGGLARGLGRPVRIPDRDEPEPDVAVVRGAATDYPDHHPGLGDIPLLVEVAESSLSWDRSEKLSIYARAGIPVYGVISLVDHQLEVYSDPDSGTGTYQARVDYGHGQTVPVVLAGQVVAQVPVAELLP